MRVACASTFFNLSQCVNCLCGTAAALICYLSSLGEFRSLLNAVHDTAEIM